MIWCAEFGNECEMPAAIDMFIRVSHLLVCFNSSANFVVYYLNGEKFRDEGITRMRAGGVALYNCYELYRAEKISLYAVARML